MNGYPKWFTPWLITLVMIVLSLSGILLFPLSMEFRFNWTMPWRLTGDERLLTTAIHVFFSLAAMLIVGALMTVHMQLGWKQKGKRRTGLLIIAAFAILGISGIGLLYSGSESLTRSSSAIHNLVGVAFFALYTLHLSANRLFGKTETKSANRRGTRTKASRK